MGDTFTKSMALLHTWAGVIIGSVLFAMFWFGTLSVFASEIDRWMLPQTRIAQATTPLSLDRLAVLAAPQIPKEAKQWRIDLPTARNPTVELTWRTASGEHARLIDPVTYTLLSPQQSHGATGFIVPFHYMLHIAWLDLGKWLVGLAAMAMLALLISGVVIHKKIFVQFFTFRPHKRLQRSALDLHNLTGVVALPFHFMIALSGLVIFMTIYFPQLHAGAYGTDTKAKAAFMAEAYGKYARKPANKPGALGSLDAMRATAQQQWGGGAPYFVRVFHPGDASSYVELRRSYANDVTMNLDQVYFDAATGKVLARFEAGPVMTAQRFISGLHFIRFDHALLRWLYFAGGLAGCVLICTGFLFWIEARRAQHAKKGLAGVRVVEGLTIGSVTGIVLATLVFMVANRLTPERADGATLEVQAFYAAWALSFAHAWWRGRAAWREQAGAIAALTVLAVVLNWATTGDHLYRTLSQGQYAVAGVDLVLVWVALTAAYIARRLRTS
jgi:uncharacterized iron-regulated membrane protein